MTVTPNNPLDSVEDVIWGGGGAKTAKWPTIGSWVGGPVQARPKVYHAKEYVKNQPGAGKPKYNKDGSPAMGIKVDVLTSLREPGDPSDDGVRRMHLEKWRQIEAVRKALREADVRSIEPGGELWVQWSGEEAGEDDGQPTKTWIAKYRPPAADTQPPGWQQPAAYAQAPAPAQQPMSAPQPPSQPVAQAQPQWSTPQAPQAQQGPAWGPQETPPTPTPAPAQPPAQPQGQNVITAAVAASLRAQGVDTSGFTIVP